MTTRPREPLNAPLPSPFPEGWYFIGSRKAIQKEGLIQKTWMGQNIVVWCDDGGSICVAGAYCPHLGSYLGPAAGGRIRDGRLVCPFHGFEYDVTGQCVATPYAPPPRAARLNVFETQEVAGLVFAWWGIEGREPQWDLPTDLSDQTGWSGISVRTLRFPGHPQDTTENSVDLGHLRYVHGYGSVDRVAEVSVEGAYLRSDFDFRRSYRIAGAIPFNMDVSACTHIFGLGYSFVEIREHTIGMDARLWVLATPVDGTLIDLSLASQVREIHDPKRRIGGLGFLPVRLRGPIMNRFIASQQEHDVRQDVVIWSRKQYRPLPRLSRSDGEIMAFRAYCAQFYPSAQDTPESLPHAFERTVQ
ncbi:MAG: Rieske 2Fe-2S domain-containing protein [Chloroflexota bacterium]|nr:Rieske 2Fe-2S domain-containing protein [Chloroflexota bacterium]MDE2885191.1 Rieske 2Fe-2S domain-containing protein [Chloroflexota bacterium]